MSSDILLRADHISKCYELYRKPAHRLLQTLCMGRKKFYDEFWALHDFSMSMKRGESIGIIGCNGSGKSTLLQILSGVLQPTTGTVQTVGRISAMLELGSGFHADYTGRENIVLQASLQGIPDSVLREKMDEIIEFAAIGDFIDQPLKTYSSGMSVRLAFAVMTQLSPDILIIDEALSVGDCFFQAKCFSHLHKQLERGVSLLFVSHSQPAVTALCSRCILLENGVMTADTDPATAFDLYMKRNAASAGSADAAPENGETAASAEEYTVSKLQPPFESRIVNRISSPAAAFRECMILENGVEVKQPRTGSDCVIRAVMDVLQPMRDYEIGCVVSTIEGVGLFSLNSFFSGGPPPPELAPGRYIVDFPFRMELLPASFYRVDLGLRIQVQGDYADKVFNALVFDVSCSGAMPPPLLFRVPTDISIRRTNP